MKAPGGEICSNCCYFNALDGSDGSCHRFPPAFAGESSPRQNHHWRFPVVSPYAWCGEYRRCVDLQPAPGATSI